MILFKFTEGIYLKMSFLVKFFLELRMDVKFGIFSGLFKALKMKELIDEVNFLF